MGLLVGAGDEEGEGVLVEPKPRALSRAAKPGEGFREYEGVRERERVSVRCGLAGLSSWRSIGRLSAELKVTISGGSELASWETCDADPGWTDGEAVCEGKSEDESVIGGPFGGLDAMTSQKDGMFAARYQYGKYGCGWRRQLESLSRAPASACGACKWAAARRKVVQGGSERSACGARAATGAGFDNRGPGRMQCAYSVLRRLFRVLRCARVPRLGVSARHPWNLSCLAEGDFTWITDCICGMEPCSPWP